MDLRSWQGNQIALLLFSLNEIHDDTSTLFLIVHLHIEKPLTLNVYDTAGNLAFIRWS